MNIRKKIRKKFNNQCDAFKYGEKLQRKYLNVTMSQKGNVYSFIIRLKNLKEYFIYKITRIFTK